MEFFGKPGTLKWDRTLSDGRHVEYLWPSLVEQLLDFKDEFEPEWLTRPHHDFPLWIMNEDCGHPDPDEDEKYEGVEDLIDAWLLRNGLDMKTWDYRYSHIHWINRARAIPMIPLAAEYELAKIEWDAHHDSGVCKLSYMGTACSGCTEGDGDFGYEVMPCRLGPQLRLIVNSYLEDLTFPRSAV